MNGPSNELKARMAKYEQELIRLRNRSHPPVPTAVTSPTDASFAVRVTNEQGHPIEDAVVTIRRSQDDERRLRCVRFTDQNGMVQTIPLPTNDLYEVSVAAPGYLRNTAQDVKAAAFTIVLPSMSEYKEGSS